MVAFARLAEICCQYLHKGSKVYIEGQLRTRKWQDQSGADRYTTEIVARELQMLDGAPQHGERQPARQAPQQAPQQAPMQAPMQAPRQAPMQAPGTPAAQQARSPQPEPVWDDDVPF